MAASKRTQPETKDPRQTQVSQGTANGEARLARKWRPLLFRVLAVLVPILLLELAARCYWFVFETPEKTGVQLNEEEVAERALSDDVIPYWFRPHDEIVVDGTPTRTNNMRLRGDEDIDLSPDYAGTRIVCLGDSVTFGYCVSSNDKCYPAVLQRRLREAGHTAQVVNMGMPRFRMQHSKLMLKEFLTRHRVDLLVVLGGWNNANDQILRPQPVSPIIAMANNHCYTLRIARKWRIVPTPDRTDRPEAIVNETGFVKYANAIKSTIRISREHGAKVALCTLPHYLRHLESEEARHQVVKHSPVGTFDQIASTVDRMNQDLRQIGRSMQVPIIDLKEIDSHELFADAVHPNDEGSREVADQVATFVLMNDLLGRSSSSN